MVKKLSKQVPLGLLKNISVYLFGCTVSQLQDLFGCRIFLVATCELSCGMWDLVPKTNFEPRSPALGAQSQPVDQQGSS